MIWNYLPGAILLEWNPFRQPNNRSPVIVSKVSIF